MEGLFSVDHTYAKIIENSLCHQFVMLDVARQLLFKFYSFCRC